MKNKSAIEKSLLDITVQFQSELDSRAKSYEITLQTDLERSLGIDSLKKAELFHRIEEAFGITLPDKWLADAKNLQDLITPIMNAGPTKSPELKTITPHLDKAGFDPLACDSFVSVLRGYAKSDPDRVHIYFQNEQGKETPITYAKLLSRAETVAASLQSYGIKPHETIAIMLPTCEEFFYTFFGILLVGAIPVPIYPPFRPDQIEEYISRSILILRSAAIRLLITFKQAELISKQIKPFIPSLITTLTVPQLLKRKEHPLSEVKITEDHPAFIQYTSGSTGNPKGVLLNHANLLANLRAAIKALNVTEKDVVVSWLPLYHDMGLIGKWLGSLYYGVPTCIMPPQSFLARPERWLWNIHYHQGTISAAPNFAYGYCTQKINNSQIEGLDLSSWRIAANGAEAVDGKIFRAFYQRFKDYGLNEKALTAVYGLAESTVALAFSSVDKVQHYDKVNREDLQLKNIATKATKLTKNSIEFASCGQPIPGHKIRIVDENDTPLPDRHIGLLQFKGPSTLQEYYQNPLATKEIKHGEWNNTGDLAYIDEGNVYITGRKKDIIIKAGRNLNPEEIEEATSQVNAVRKGCVIAFGATDPLTGTESIVIVAELRPTAKSSHQKIREEILATVSAQLGDAPDHIVLVSPGTVPKTSSGKLRRARAKQDYLDGKLAGRKIPMWWQLAKIFSRSVIKTVSVNLGRVLRVGYTTYVFALLLLAVLPLWILVLLLPRKMSATCLQKSLRFLLPIAGMPLIIKGAEHLTQHKPCIFVANHCSYIDSLVMLALLPSQVVFIAKREVLKVPILASFVKRLQYICVKRDQVHDGLSALSETSKAIKKGHSVMIFPEGGIGSTPGIRTFKSGAFQLAATTSTYVCPITIIGTRRILRNEKFLLRPGKIKIFVHPALKAIDDSWVSVSKLSDDTREIITLKSDEMLINLHHTD